MRASRVCESAEGSKFTVHAFGKSFEAALSPVPGLHNVLDALAAAAVGLLLGLSPEQIAEGLRSICAAAAGGHKCGGLDDH